LVFVRFVVGILDPNMSPWAPGPIHKLLIDCFFISIHIF